ncbi:MLO-like protein 3 [Argentina anserina]|uniref:MLO-like protein 3 n=1 Tax=Argentina anserina TaxID=57926 RepID=UPI0021768EDD|nr:MLO-like protein 3 [Potentilla anserina]
MAEAAVEETTLEYTPTWALATVCFFFISISIVLEHLIYLLVSWLKKHRKTALTDAVEKLKSELMLLGFVSLLLAVTQDRISKICISEKLGNIMLPCRKALNETPKVETVEHYVNKFAAHINSSSAHVVFDEMLRQTQRILAEEEEATVEDYCGDGKVSLVTKNALHQLHLLIFALAVMHIVYSVLTMALGRAKMRRWEAWEAETRTMEYQVANDPNRFRLTRQTTFAERHMNSCTETSFHLWIKCFFRQFYNSVAKVDYFTMRHGFISAHLSNRHNNFDFQKYIQRSLEEDFKKLVGISPVMWFAVAVFMLVDVYGWHVYLWLSYVPLLVVLVLGTKLEYIVAKMALQIKEQNNVIIGTPLVRLNDDHFWFKRPRFVLKLLHYTLFLNAFELAFFIWVTVQFGFKSCYHEHMVIIVTRIFLAVTTQVLCSYITLPLYALVTQMGSQFKGKILEDNMAGILKQWHGDVRRKRRKEERESHSGRTSFSVEWSSMRHSISSYMRPSPSRRGENADISNRGDNREEIVELEESSSSRGQIRVDDFRT